MHLPSLAVEPISAIKKVSQIIDEIKKNNLKVGVIGSSLGGFYASHLATTYNLPCVLINPAVHAYDLLANETGINSNFHTGIKETFKHNYIKQLKQLEQKPKPENTLLLLQAGDKTLNYELALHYYANCHVYKGLEGNHGFEHFEDFLPIIYRFFQNNA